MKPDYPMKRFALVIAACLAMSVSVLAQTDSATKSAEIQLKMRQNALLIQITPLLMSRDQLNKLLTDMEKIREKQKKIYAMEAEILAKLEPDIDKSINAAVETGSYPSKETQAKINKAITNMQLNRAIESGKMIEDLLAFCKKNFNEGQLRCMRGSFEPELIDPVGKGKNLKDDDKLVYFIRMIFLDDQTYPILSRMYKYAK
jgi:hypothetical protein